MNNGKSLIKVVYFIAFGLAGILLVSCGGHSMKGMIVFTRVPTGNFDAGKETKQFNYAGAQIAAIYPDKPDESEIVLTRNFFSACSPNLSFDASRMLFIGQKNEQDAWQVWEMDLKHRTLNKITDFKESCSGPAYLPGHRLVFSREMPDTGIGVTNALFTMNLDGSNLQQISFHPHFDLVSTILRDGRILMYSKLLFPGIGKNKYLAIRPNGTKTELFYQGADSSVTGIKMNENLEGLIYFTEQSSTNAGKRDVISIRYNRPFHSRVNYTSEITGDFYSVLPLASGEMIVSYQASVDQNIGLFHFKQGEKMPEPLISDAEFHLIEPVLVEPFERPKALPNDLMMDYPTGLILCQDINVTSVSDTNHSSNLKATKIEILGLQESYGIVEVEKDGSFFLKVKADTPFRIQTLNNDNDVVSGPSDWIWVRPFERRGCVGCHEDPELVPENIVPLAVNHFPFVIPVDSTQKLKRDETYKLGNMHE